MNWIPPTKPFRACLSMQTQQLAVALLPPSQCRACRYEEDEVLIRVFILTKISCYHHTMNHDRVINWHRKSSSERRRPLFYRLASEYVPNYHFGDEIHLEHGPPTDPLQSKELQPPLHALMLCSFLTKRRSSFATPHRQDSCFLSPSWL